MDKKLEAWLQRIEDKLETIKDDHNKRLILLEERQGVLRDTVKSWSDAISGIVKKLLLIFVGVILSGLVSGWQHGKQILEWIVGK